MVTFTHFATLWLVKASKCRQIVHLLYEYRDLFIDMAVRNNRQENKAINGKKFHVDILLVCLFLSVSYIRISVRSSFILI